MATPNVKVDIADYCEIGNDEIQSANIHGVPRSLSPVKPRKKAAYFDGEMSDGSCRIRFVGFKAEQRQRLLSFTEKDEPVELHNCQIKRSRQGHEMEVLLKTATVIKPSTKTFDLSNDIDTPPTPVTLVEVHAMPEYSKVTVIVKVLSKGDPIKLDNGKTKQEVMVADSSGVIIVTLWEEKIDLLELSKSYKLTEFMIREFNMMKSLSLSRQGSIIEEIDDIGTVQENTPENIRVQQLPIASRTQTSLP